MKQIARSEFKRSLYNSHEINVYHSWILFFFYCFCLGDHAARMHLNLVSWLLSPVCIGISMVLTRCEIHLRSF